MTASALIAASRVIRQGGVVAYPTEAVFGLGCDPWNAAAVHQLLDLKNRPLGKGLIIIAAEFSQLRPFVGSIPVSLREQLLATWPGPVTWLLPARPGLPRWLRGRHASIAVRVTDHAGAAALCTAVASNCASMQGGRWANGGALVSTSANIAGRAPCRDARCVRRVFGAQVGCVLPGVIGDSLTPTRIVDGVSGRVVRY